MNRLIVRTVLFGVLTLYTAYALDEQYDESQSSGEVIGRIQIPAIGIDFVIREGIAPSIIDRGVAHWAGSVLPGQPKPGKMILAGHRVLSKAPFNRLDELKKGDEIFVSGNDEVRILYKVTDSPTVIHNNERWILNEDDPRDHRLTIFTCHPKGSKKKRLVVFATHSPY
jgi:sortase A